MVTKLNLVNSWLIGWIQKVLGKSTSPLHPDYLISSASSLTWGLSLTWLSHGLQSSPTLLLFCCCELRCLLLNSTQYSVPFGLLWQDILKTQRWGPTKLDFYLSAGPMCLCPSPHSHWKRCWFFWQREHLNLMPYHLGRDPERAGFCYSFCCFKSLRSQALFFYYLPP